MTIIGSAYVDIRALTEKLRADIDAAFKTLPNEFNIDIEGNADKLRADVEEAVKEAGVGEHIDVAVEASTEAARVEVDRLVEDESLRTINVDVDVDTAGADAHIAEFQRAHSNDDINFNVDADVTGADEHLNVFRRFWDLRRISWTLVVETGQALAELAFVRLAVDGLNKTKLALDSKPAQKALEALQQGLQKTGKVTQDYLMQLSGAKTVLDVAEEFIALKRNIGDTAVTMAKFTLTKGVMGTALIGLGADAFSLTGSLIALGGYLTVMPGMFFTMKAVMGITSLAFSDMKKAVPALAQEFQNLKNVMVQGFWSQAQKPFEDLFVRSNVLRSNLVDLSKAVGSFWGAFATSAAGTQNMNLLVSSFHFIRDGLNNAKGGVDNFLNALLKLINFGTSQLPGMGKYFVDWSAAFDAWVTKVGNDGSLARWLQDARDAFVGVKNVVGGLIGIFEGVSRAATAAGGTTIDTLGNALQALAADIKTADFQNTLVLIFKGAHDALLEITGSLPSLGHAISDIAPALSVGFKNLGAAVGDLIRDISIALSQPAMKQGLKDFTGGLLQGVEGLQKAMAPLGDKMGIFLSLVGQVLTVIGTEIGNLGATVLPIMSDFFAALNPLVKPLGDLVDIIIGALGPALKVLVDDGIRPVVDALMKVIGPVGDVVKVFGDALAPVLKPIVDIIVMIVKQAADLVVALAPLISSVLKLVAAVAPEIFKALGDILGFVITVVVDLVKALAPLLQAVIDGVTWFLSLHGVMEGIHVLIDVFAGVIGALTGALGAILAPILAIVGAFALWNAIMAISPLTWIILGVVALSIGIGLLVANWDTVVKVVGDFIGGVGKALGDWLGQTAGMFVDFGKNTIGMFVDFFNNTVGMFRDFFGKVGSTVTDFVGKVGEFFKPFVDAIVGFFKFIWDTDVKIWTDFWNAIVNFFRPYIEIIGKIIKDLVAIFDKLFVEPVQKFIPLWNNFWNSVWKTVSDWFDKTTKPVRDFVNTVVKNVSDFVNTVTKAWNDFWNSLVTTVRQWVTNVLIEYYKFITPIVKAWNDFWTTIWNNVTKFVGDIVNTVTKWWNDLVDKWNWGVAFVKALWNAYWAYLGKIVGDFVNTIVNTVSDWWNKLVELWNVGVKVVSDQWNGFWKGLQDLWNGFVGFFNDAITNFWNFLQDAWQGGINIVHDIMANGWGAIGNFISDVWNNIVGFIRVTIATIVFNITSFILTVEKNWHDFWDGVWNFLKDSWDNIVRAVSDGIDHVTQFFRDLPDTVKNLLSGAINWLVDTGKNIVQGLINGITNFIGGVGKALTDGISGAIDGVKNMLGIHSPSRVFHGFGVNIVDGLINGLSSKHDDLKKAMGDLADITTGTFNSATGSASGVSGSTRKSLLTSMGVVAGSATMTGGAPVVQPIVNVYPSAALNEQQVGNMAASTLFWQMNNSF